jgi:hypothetical protein
VLVCPNYHRTIRLCDVPFDSISNALSFTAVMDVLKLLQHTLAEG